MVICRNILKKISSLCFIMALACLSCVNVADAETVSSTDCSSSNTKYLGYSGSSVNTCNTVANMQKAKSSSYLAQQGGECTTKASSCTNSSIKSVSEYKSAGEQGCFQYMPVQGAISVSSVVGMRPVDIGASSSKCLLDEETGIKMRQHAGMDVSVACGKNLEVPADGWVSGISWGCKGTGDAGAGVGAGNYIIFKHPMNPNSNDYKTGCKFYYTKFYHMESKKSDIALDRAVKKGDVFGTVGSTNCSNSVLKNSYACHMHMEVHKCKHNGEILNPLCSNNQNLCNGAENVDATPLNGELSSGGLPDSNNSAPVNPHLGKKEDCSLFDDPNCKAGKETASQNSVESAEKKCASLLPPDVTSTDYDTCKKNCDKNFHPPMLSPDNCYAACKKLITDITLIPNYEKCIREHSVLTIKKSACPTKTKNKAECEKRNAAIDSGGEYCAPVEEDKESENKEDKKDTSCAITKNSRGTTKGHGLCGHEGKEISSDITQAIADASKKYGIPASLFAAFIEVESGGTWNPKIQACIGDGGGGLVQFQPMTWAQYALTGTNTVWEPAHVAVGQKEGSYKTIKGQGKCTGKNGRPLTEADRFDAYANIMCAGALFSDNLKSVGGDVNCAILAHNKGPTGAKNYKKSNGTCDNASYFKKIQEAQKKIAAANGCSLDSLGNSNCEYFTIPSSGDSYGAASGSYLGGKDPIFGSDYRCNINDNYSSYTGCMFCPLFKTIFDTSSLLAKKSHKIFADSLITLLAIGLSIALSMIVLQYLSSMSQKDPMQLLNEIIRKIMVVVLVVALLKLDVVEFFNLFVAKFLTTGFKLAELIISSSSAQMHEEAWAFTSGGLPPEMGNSMLNTIYTIQDRLLHMLALGSNSMCIAFFVKSWHNIVIFPHFGYLLTGLFLWVVAVIFMVIYPFLLIDCVLQFTIASALFPVAIASSAFKLTSRYFNVFKIVNIFFNAMFTFLFLTIIMFILLAGIEKTVSETITNIYNSSNSSGLFDLSKLGWYSITFLKIVFFVFLGKAVLEDIPSFAQEFAKGLSFGASGGNMTKGIGGKLGGVAADIGKKYGGRTLGAATKITKNITTGGAKGVASVARNIASGFRGARHANTVNRIRSQASASAASIASGATTATAAAATTWVAGRTWYGAKTMSRVVKDENGNDILESKRRSLFKKDTVITRSDGTVTATTRKGKNGKIKESYNMDSSIKKSLLNKDGTINKNAINRLSQNSKLSKDLTDKALLNELMKQRFPGAGSKLSFGLKWPPVSKTKLGTLEGEYSSENIKRYLDDKGREVFEVIRTGKDGSSNISRMVKGDKRFLVEHEHVTADGKYHLLSSDGAVQKVENGRYFEYKGNMVKDISNVKFSNSEAYAGANIFDSDGNVNHEFEDDDIMFNQADGGRYHRQMYIHGDPGTDYKFGK